MIPVIVVSIYLVIIAVIGSVAFRKTQANTEDFFLANRTVGSMVFFLSLFATNMTAFAILGSPVAGPDGKTVGRLVDVLVDDAGVPQAAVIDFGGFMGVGARKIAVHWSVLHFSPTNPKQPITLNLTADQIKTAPEYINPAQPAPVVVPAQASAPSAAVPARPPSSSNSQ